MGRHRGRSVSAEILAVGADAETILDEALERPEKKKERKKEKPSRAEKPKPKPLRSHVTAARVLLLLAIAVFGFLSQLRTSPLKLDLACVALSLVALAGAVGYRAALPRFVHGQKPVEDNTRAFTALAISIGGGILSFIFFVFISDAAHANDTPPSNGSSAVVIVLASWLVVLAIMVLRFTRKTAALLSVLAKAPPFEEGFRDHAWGCAVGVVRDPTPVNVEGDLHAVAQIVDVRVQSGSDPDIVVETVINEGTFLVDTEDAGTFELDPKDATWASSVRRLVHEDETRKKWTYVVPLGGSIVVAGRAARSTKKKAKTARFTKGGQGALLFYATAAHEDAQAEIRRLVSRRLGVLALIVGCAGAMVAWAIAAAPHLPPFHLESSGD